MDYAIRAAAQFIQMPQNEASDVACVRKVMGSLLSKGMKRSRSGVGKNTSDTIGDYSFFVRAAAERAPGGSFKTFGDSPTYQFAGSTNLCAAVTGAASVLKSRDAFLSAVEIGDQEGKIGAGVDGATATALTAGGVIAWVHRPLTITDEILTHFGIRTLNSVQVKVGGGFNVAWTLFYSLLIPVGSWGLYEVERVASKLQGKQGNEKVQYLLDFLDREAKVSGKIDKKLWNLTPQGEKTLERLMQIEKGRACQRAQLARATSADVVKELEKAKESRLLERSALGQERATQEVKALCAKVDRAIRRNRIINGLLLLTGVLGTVAFILLFHHVALVAAFVLFIISAVTMLGADVPELLSSSKGGLAGRWDRPLLKFSAGLGVIATVGSIVLLCIGLSNPLAFIAAMVISALWLGSLAWGWHKINVNERLYWKENPTLETFLAELENDGDLSVYKRLPKGDKQRIKALLSQSPEKVLPDHLKCYNYDDRFAERYLYASERDDKIIEKALAETLQEDLDQEVAQILNAFEKGEDVRGRILGQEKVLRKIWEKSLKNEGSRFVKDPDCDRGRFASVVRTCIEEKRAVGLM